MGNKGLQSPALPLGHITKRLQKKREYLPFLFRSDPYLQLVTISILEANYYKFNKHMIYIKQFFPTKKHLTKFKQILIKLLIITLKFLNKTYLTFISFQLWKQISKLVKIEE
ncbi:hypothetical protein V6Z12_D04G199900 [Gossypium hirsutum]